MAETALTVTRLTPRDEDWPHQLNRLIDPPRQLWVKGDPRWLKEAQVAIVGARSATAYGTTVAADLATQLSSEGYVITSGAAFGIDGAAHRGVLAVKRPTIAVLAGGVDRPHPASHSQLLEKIAEEGCIVSEYDEWYFQGLRDTITMLDAIRDDPRCQGRTLVYVSSW